MPKRILLVDDHRHSREGLRESLLRDGYEVEAASDGWQAIKKVKESPFQVAIIGPRPSAGSWCGYERVGPHTYLSGFSSRHHDHRRQR
ncbi:MAG TPA: response regulator [Candidatus Methylomirabilis sp.]|nr:response regulator [Candidatus Methylomirabilis sp.]